jgi:hypothetical protein
MELRPLDQRRHLETETLEWQAIQREARECLQWKVIEGTLPNDLGRYRIHQPYFDLVGGQALAFLRVQDSEGTLKLDKIGGAYAWIPKGVMIQGWKGIRILGVDRNLQHRINEDLNGSILEIDWTSQCAGHITVSRGVLVVGHF